MRFAIIQTGGKQYKVQEGQSLKIEKLDIHEGKPVTFNKVLLTYEEGKGVNLGRPFLESINVYGEVVSQGKGEKIIVFKYKPKKRYRRKIGHRQSYSLVTITGIGKTNAGAQPEKKVKTPRAKAKTSQRAALKQEGNNLTISN